MRPRYVMWSKSRARMVLALTTDDLPEAPWVLHESKSCWIGSVFYVGQPCETVADNEAWLRSLQMDVRRGPTGPRSTYGVLQKDIQELVKVLKARRPEEIGV